MCVIMDELQISSNCSQQAGQDTYIDDAVWVL